MQLLPGKGQKLAFKTRLKQFCEQAVERRIVIARNAMDSAQDAANGEEKSSAGDKYETSRAMNHLQKDMHARQLAAHLQELSAIQSVPTNILYDKVTTGAVIESTGMLFFIAAGLGKQDIDGTDVFFISPQSPLAKAWADKRKGDVIVFKNEMAIIEVY